MAAICRMSITDALLDNPGVIFDSMDLAARAQKPKKKEFS